MGHGQATIQTLLGGLLKNRHLVAGMRQVMIMTLWEQVVGSIVAQKSWPESVKDGVLTVGVTSHAWAEELHLLKGQIVSRYRQLLGRAALKDVTFRVSRRKARDRGVPAPAAPLHPAREERLPVQPVPDTVLNGVTNPEVRSLLGPVFARLRAERTWKQEHGWARCPVCQHIGHGPTCPHCAAQLAPGTP
jgi:predicted nucleic acid-binding Zn ribbon protein